MIAFHLTLLLMNLGVLVFTVHQYLLTRFLLDYSKDYEKKLNDHLELIVVIDAETTRLNSEQEAMKQVLGHLHTRSEELLMLWQDHSPG